MVPRRIAINFETAPRYWAPNHEFSTMMYSLSPMPSAVEPYLNKVMMAIRDQVGSKNPQLSEDIDIFIKQESNHYNLHNKLNKVVYAYYPDLQPHGKDLFDDYKTFLSKKSLKFNAAYSAGFENIALFMAKYYYENADHLFEGSDPRIKALFLWHYGEEFEHRSTVHDAFKAISGNYFLRVYGALYALWHLGKFKKLLNHVALSADRENMSDEEVRASRAREAAVNKHMNSYTLPRMLRIFLPYYDPRKQKPPKGMDAALTYYEKAALDPAWQPV